MKMTIREQLEAMLTEYDKAIEICKKQVDKNRCPHCNKKVLALYRTTGEMVMPIFMPIDNSGDHRNYWSLVYDTDIDEPIRLEIPRVTVREGDTEHVFG